MRSIFEVLAEPRRREILALLCAGERPAGELVDRLGIAQPTVSKHLKLARELEEWPTHCRVLWSDRLAVLARHLDEML